MNGSAVPARPYAEVLRDELVQAATRQHVLRRRRRAIVKAGAGLVVVAGVAVVIVGLLVAPSETPASADPAVRVTREEATTLVEILTPDRPDAVLADLRAAGLDADRVDRTTGPSRVGTVVSVVVEGASIPTGKTDGLSVYVDGRAHIIIGVGAAAEPGDGYDTPTDAFEIGEPLHCVSWPGQSAADVIALADASDLDIRVMDAANRPIDPADAEGVVLAASAFSPTAIQVRLTDGPVAPAPAECGTAPGQG